MMQKTYNAINQNQLRIRESLSKNASKTRRVIFLQSDIEEWFQKLDSCNRLILDTLQNKVTPLLNQSYQDEQEADSKIAYSFTQFGKEIDKLIELYEDIKHHFSHDFEEQEVIDAFVSICSVKLKELLLLHVNIKDAMQNTPEDAKIEYAPDIHTQIEFIQKYQKEVAQNSNTSSWLLPLAAAFGVGFMLGGE
jgi:hypothetical protein